MARSTDVQQNLRASDMKSRKRRAAALRICSLILVEMLPKTASSNTSSVNGKSILGIMQNVPPNHCWIETDCDPGKVCHMSIMITGAPAKHLLKTLKERVKPDKEFKEMGIKIYTSKDGLLNCDETDNTRPFCNIFFNSQGLKIEPALSCE
jgi:hypothetical protein